MALNLIAQDYIDRGMTAYSETLTGEHLAETETDCTDKNGNLDIMKWVYFNYAAESLNSEYTRLEIKSCELSDSIDYAIGYADALENGSNHRVNSAEDAKNAQELMNNYAQFKSDLGIEDKR